MLTTSSAFSGFSVDDTDAARTFYRDTLGLDVREAGMGGMLELHITGGAPILVYPKDDHRPATYTVLNLVVADIDLAADELIEAGAELLRYPDSHQDEKGIARSDDPARGPSIAWFTDPAGNILSILEA